MLHAQTGTKWRRVGAKQEKKQPALKQTLWILFVPAGRARRESNSRPRIEFAPRDRRTPRFRFRSGDRAQISASSCPPLCSRVSDAFAQQRETKSDIGRSDRIRNKNQPRLALAASLSTGPSAIIASTTDDRSAKRETALEKRDSKGRDENDASWTHSATCSS